MWLQTRMYLLVALLFGILFAAFFGIGQAMHVTGYLPYLVLSLVMLGIQYLVGPYLVGMMMRVKYVTPEQEPALHQMVAELAQQANLPKPRVGVSELSMPNAFAFGRTQRDGRICVTRGILNILNHDELKAVLGHEMSHIKHRDMAIITALSAIPMILYYVALNFMWGGRRDREGNYTMLIGIGAFVLYQITNLLVLYGSRIREYYADLGSAQLGNQPHQLATALYKLSQANTRPKKEELRQTQGARAFFVSDPTRSLMEVRQLSEIDRRHAGVISYDDLMDLRQKEVRISFGEKLMEIFMTHPNMVKRVKHLSTLIA